MYDILTVQAACSTAAGTVTGDSALDDALLDQSRGGALHDAQEGEGEGEGDPPAVKAEGDELLDRLRVVPLLGLQY